ncbi:hypothetical protein GXP67_24575 [Rhodocytophaga rosea]|uniref:Uncharacterized protein n=1 Tax=Rhodocytophaga rosea TaxID=2704465 RepID=A0A6C0GNI3_9BACT|nr:hypothetical protein [Rhodocytophaga rosea]QHT69595.1 hypothetical protein GXP67_24575 [Rhodocytophaga rosea]
MLEIVNQLRMALPEKYFKNPYAVTKGSLLTRLKRVIHPGSKQPAFLSRTITRPTIEHMIAMDPSEAADSSRINPSIKKYFPQAEIIFTGVTVYHLALNDIISNFNEQKDKYLLDFLMTVDNLYAQSGENHYATAIGFKLILALEIAHA